MLQMCSRLEISDDLCDHRRNLYNTLAFEVSKAIWLLGLDLYTGGDEEVLDPEAVFTFDRTTNVVEVFKENNLQGEF